MELPLTVELTDGSTLEGRLDDVAKDSAVEIVAYAFAVEDIDHSDDLRGGV